MFGPYNSQWLRVESWKGIDSIFYSDYYPGFYPYLCGWRRWWSMALELHFRYQKLWIWETLRFKFNPLMTIFSQADVSLKYQSREQLFPIRLMNIYPRVCYTFWRILIIKLGICISWGASDAFRPMITSTPSFPNRAAKMHDDKNSCSCFVVDWLWSNWSLDFVYQLNFGQIIDRAGRYFVFRNQFANWLGFKS